MCEKAMVHKGIHCNRFAKKKSYILMAMYKQLVLISTWNKLYIESN